MEILANELSLHGQFESAEIFLNRSFSEFLKILIFLEKVEKPVLKNHNFYDSQITETKNLYSIINDRNLTRTNDVLRRYRIFLDKIINSPFWEDNPHNDSDSKYSIEDIDIGKTSIAESFERSSLLISFLPSNFENDIFQVLKNETESKNVYNFTYCNYLAKHLYENDQISFHQYCIIKFNNSKLDFSEINFEKSFENINQKSDENEFLNSFELFDEMEWSQILSQGGTGKDKVGLAMQKYSDQGYFSSYNKSQTIFKFRCSQKYRVFGYRDRDKFYLLEFDLTHKLSD